MLNAAPEAYCIDSASLERRTLLVCWKDGHRSRFHPFWLRHQCQCNTCGTPVTAVRGMRLHHIPETVVTRLTPVRIDRVELVWDHDDHKSHYAARWLRDHCYSDQERARRKHRPVYWDRRIAND